MPRCLLTVPMLFGLTALLASQGCERPADKPKPAKQAGTTPAATTKSVEDDLAAAQRPLGGQMPAEPPSGLPLGHPPIDATTPPTRGMAMPPGQPADEPVQLSYDVPETWKAEVPNTAMRQAQYLLPPAAGDTTDAHLALLYLGPRGGAGIEVTVQMWLSQFSTETGDPIGPEELERESFQVNDLDVTVIAISGYHTSSTMAGGTGERSATKHRLLGAIVSGPGGPWFFRAVGPTASIAAARDDFMLMLRSVRRSAGQ
ncbi:MAG: hypothetical protein KKB50_10505 [Planctomycetes bacterium]|nr:hypothetical protein [Planctomycetota bacterium]